MDKVVPLNNIVTVIPKEDLEVPELTIAIEEPKGYCGHENVRVYPFYRRVNCRECQAVIDPFDWIMKLGQEERNLHSNLYWLKREIKNLQEDKKRLQKDITNLKAQKRKLL